MEGIVKSSQQVGIGESHVQKCDNEFPPHEAIVMKLFYSEPTTSRCTWSTYHF
ncbi:hypothetical protein I3843_06G147600 [Carya illinoinensis]|uniref:Uncharacterized protein n=1 Tax=Carya illinoinensis TaxID=32201 RepID=A0A922EYL3_CARIL|nr:hypothetical protein I3842_06G155500 [Carya illinoinensis]KAG6709907.1 hypothetical protein I3842_06G155500 [Carya illinoinensis]KAG7976419.1 hypothetical protein I3843_06G147600 [Carya illinoinensis]